MGQVFSGCTNGDLTKQKLARLEDYSRINPALELSHNQSFLQHDLHYLTMEDRWFNVYVAPGRRLQNVDAHAFAVQYQRYKYEQGYYGIVFEDIDVDLPAQYASTDNQKAAAAAATTAGDAQRDRADVYIPEWKYLIRRGVPLRKTRNLLLQMWRVASVRDAYEHFQTLCKVHFEGRSTQNMRLVPTFSHYERLDEKACVPVVSAHGRNALHRIMWLLKERNAQLEYNPLVAQTVAFALMFLEDYEAFGLVQQLISDSCECLKEGQESDRIRQIRWHFTMRPCDFVRNSKSFIELAERRSGDFRAVSQHLAAINLRLYEQFHEWASTVFSACLRFNTTLRVLTVFMNEGIRVLFKIAYGICMLLRKALLKCKTADEAREVFAKCNLDENVDATDKLFKVAYTLKIRSVPRPFFQIHLSQPIRLHANKVLYRPRLDSNSDILKYEHFEAIWEWMPSTHKLSNPKLLFSTRAHGYSYHQIFAKMQALNQIRPLLFIFKVAENKVFGAFLEFFRARNSDNILKWQATTNCFVFKLLPEESVHYAQEDTKDMAKIYDDHLVIGQEMPAIFLKHDLTGSTYACQTYDSAPLIDGDSNGDFRCLHLEVYVIDW